MERKMMVKKTGRMTREVGDLYKLNNAGTKIGPSIGKRACVRYQKGGWVP